MRKQQRFSLHCQPGCGTIAVLRQGSTTMKTTAMTAEERVRYMTQAPVRRLILEMSAPTVISMLVTSFYNMADGVASVGGGRRAAGIVFDPGRQYPAKSIRACRRGVRPARRGSAHTARGRRPAARLRAFALALPMGLSVLKTFRSDAPTPAHTLREE